MSPDVQELAQADTVDSLRRVMEDDELWQTLIDTVRWTTDAYKDIDVTEAERTAFEQLLMNYGVGLITLLRMRGRVDA